MKNIDVEGWWMNEQILGQEAILWKQTRVKWEYKGWQTRSSAEIDTRDFNKLGEDGWEVCSFHHFQDNLGWMTQVLFKRIKE